ncbi:Uu.00g128390.m01.CDS01 [Anthostomella pinea]|uniref:Uu.00g128390.m01.CDS01 n=1 Tax=Anthostomella pinea TaxID=933095 RepID=A0AAI8YHV9_9PEZI|nr:Uu.00g128390.m01.CDS01 [Anthostomella pinea]
MNTATVGMAVTPTVLSTFLSHYLNRKPLRQRPTAHLSYDEGLHLIRSFLAFASHHSVEDLQAFTAQWVPHPVWVSVEEVNIPEDKLVESANVLQEQLGPDGIRKVGGRNWWQWRGPAATPLKCEWIEMRSDYNERKRTGDQAKRVMLYVHGGAYFFGSIDEHRYQMQRHARKLKARVFAPEYRLSPQFPFPCGLQDCLAAYLYLLTVQDPTTIILAGDSAGGGMVVSMLVTMRDRGIPMPAGAILISPWVDLTHSFPSVAGDCPLDYIPQHGFHHKPSKAWPPLNADEYAILKDQIANNTKPGLTKLMKPAAVDQKLSQNLDQLPSALDLDNGSPRNSMAETTYISINLDGKEVQLKDQIQMYTTNELLSHPLVSPVMQPTLGGLPPLLIMTGGGEILRDEQIYLAHKCAHPEKYLPGDINMHESARKQLARFKPTDVQLQIWDDLCHVAPTLSFTHPAKFMYRSIAQFGAWALARAQKVDIEILDDDDISFISSSGSDSDGSSAQEKKEPEVTEGDQPQVGKAGDPLPPFTHHMIRQRVNRHGIIRPLEPAADLPGCTLHPNEIGVVKEGPVRKWLEARHQWDTRYGSTRAKIHKKRLKEMAAGYVGFDGETPPPSALASRRKGGDDYYGKKKKRQKSMGLALWSLWGSKHDEATVGREQDAEKEPETKVAVKVATNEEGEGARSHSDIQKQENAVARKGLLGSRSRSRTKIVRYERQIAADDDDDEVNENTPAAVLMAKRDEKAKQEVEVEPPLPSPRSNLLSPDYMPPETGVTGKRPIVGGIAVPFSLNKDAETASMLTLNSKMDQPSRVVSPRPMSSQANPLGQTSAAAAAAATDKARDEVVKPEELTQKGAPAAVTPGGAGPEPASAQNIVLGLEITPGIVVDSHDERPPLESFVTAQEDLPRAQ